MRIVFVGTIEFSQSCLEAVMENGGDVVAVLTLDEKNAGFHSDYADLSEFANTRGIPVHRIKNINHPENVELVHSFQPDVIFVFGWSQLISNRILDIPPLGCVGTHPALLPRNRGRHPVIWALVEGLKESGLTFFYLDEGADSGDILWQKSFPILLEDDAASVYAKTVILARKGIADFLPLLQDGVAPRTPQDHSQATYWRKRTQKDGEIDFSESGETIYNLVRALTHPYVGAHTYASGDEVKIWCASIPHQPASEAVAGLDPGTVFGCTGDGFKVRTVDGYITISEYQMEHGGIMHHGTKLGASR